MDGCSSWETRLMLPQWSNDPWSASTTNPGLIAPSILNSIAGEGFMDSDHQTGLLSSSSIPRTMIVSPLSEPGLMGIDGSGSGSGSKSRSLDCLLSGSTTKTDPASIEDDGISLFFSDCNQKRRDHTNPGFGSFGPNKRIRKSDPGLDSGVNISFRQGSGSEPDPEAIQQMKEMIYRAAVFRPVSFGAEEAAEKPKRRNVRISSDPQTVAARQRRERISERLRVLQKLVPGGSKMDTASMLDEAANYLKFLRNQVKALEASGGSSRNNNNADHLNTPCGNENYLLYPPVNLQFSPLPFTPMQGHVASTSFSIQNPSHIHLPKCSKPRLFALDHPVS